MTTTAAESIRIRITESSQPEGLPSALPNHGPDEYVALLVPPDHPEVGPLLLESRSAPVKPATRPEAGATARGEIPDAADEPHPRELTREEGQRLLDERARRYLGMSGEEFRRRYEAGELDSDNDHVLGLALLLPLGE
jgi:hypothetical protein